MLLRKRWRLAVEEALRRSPVVLLLGPRQCGKTTLARQVAAARRAVYFDLEDPVDARRLAEPGQALAGLRGLVVIDEVQTQPELLRVIRVLADRNPLPVRFLLLGSASPHLVKGAAESLAGRVAHVDLGGFTLAETTAQNWRRLWLRGGYPRSYLAGREVDSQTWRRDYIRTFLERDIPQLGLAIPAAALRRFWMMVAHYHGQVWNAAEFARSIGSAEATARRYLDILTGAFVVRQLQPWHENLKKRQVKAPKVYVRDSGLLHALLELPDRHALTGSPKLGASWEGFALEQVLAFYRTDNAFFWATHAGAELDLLIMVNGKRWGFEFKYADAPALTKSMHIALSDLKLDRLTVIYPGTTPYRLAEKVAVMPLAQLV